MTTNSGQEHAGEGVARHRDEITKLAAPFYIRWTSGPNYERAFLCVDDGEPDMCDFAEVTFGRAKLFEAGLAAALEKLTRERDEARADHEWMRDNRNKWQDATTRERNRAEAADARIAALEAENARLRQTIMDWHITNLPPELKRDDT